MSDLFYCSLHTYDQLNVPDATECVGTQEEVEEFLTSILQATEWDPPPRFVCGKLVQVCADRAQLLEDGVAEDADGTVSLWGLNTGISRRDHYWIKYDDPSIKFYRCIPKRIFICIEDDA